MQNKVQKDLEGRPRFPKGDSGGLKVIPGTSREPRGAPRDAHQSPGRLVESKGRQQILRGYKKGLFQVHMEDNPKPSLFRSLAVSKLLCVVAVSPIAFTAVLIDLMLFIP